MSPRLAARLALWLFSTPAPLRLQRARNARIGAARLSTLHLERGSIQLYQWGTSSPTVILAHGWSSRAERLTAFVDPLVSAGFSVVAFDAPAHGRSSGRFTDIRSYQTALEHVLLRTRTPRAIIAHSFGARAASLMLSAGRCTQLRAAVLIGIPPHIRYMFEQFKLVLRLAPAVTELLDRHYVERFSAPPEEHACVPPGPAEWPTTLFVHDREDEVAPFALAKALAAKIPAARLLETRSLRHCGALDDSDAIARVTDFLRSQCKEPRCAERPQSDAGRQPTL